MAEPVPFVWMEESNGVLGVPNHTKRKLRSKHFEFHGWGSKPLIEFLDSIGKDASDKLSQHEVTTTITEYVKENGLLHPEKKKRVLCDGKLQYLFGRKSVARNKIYDLLEAHFADNQENLEDVIENCPEKEELAAMENHRRAKLSNSDNSSYTLNSCFAAIRSENIKHVYLKRSLVLDLLKELQYFETKIVGSFVRIKTDPNDYLQKNSHQLVLVTGVRRAGDNGNNGIDIFLEVSNLKSGVPICKLSDDNFSMEECEDLKHRVKVGLIKRPIVVEVEEKAKILHEDITKHWIVRELYLLQNLIDQANEKGWRKELFEYLERRQKLKSATEQTRLLLEAAKIIPDEIESEPETGLQNYPDKMKEGSSDGPENKKGAIIERPVAVVDSSCAKSLVEEKNESLEKIMIELSSSSDEDEGEGRNVNDGEEQKWHYMDPQGDTQGPFSLACLKRWSDAHYFPTGFKVWKIGGHPIFLTHLLLSIPPSI